jgi:hypothetical protein
MRRKSFKEFDTSKEEIVVDGVLSSAGSKNSVQTFGYAGDKKDILYQW